MLKSKVHRVTVTASCLHYEGSFTLDEALMEAANMVPYERIEIYNVNNGARFATYVIPGPRHQGDACINGAAARMGDQGDLIIIATYTDLEEADLDGYAPTNVYVDQHNRVREVATPGVTPPFTPYVAS